MNNLARNTDPDTSHIAADRHVKSGKHGTNLAKVFDGIRRYPGHTAGEIAKKIRLDYIEFNRRVSELVRRGKARRGKSRICKVRGTSCTTLYSQ